MVVWNRRKPLGKVMSHIRVNEFRPGSDLPQLFSTVQGFNFFGSAPLLRHRRLPQGPRGFTVVSVTSTGHEGSFVEPDRRVLTILTGGRSEVSVSGARYALKPGDVFHIGQAEWHSRLTPETEGGAYESYSVIAPPGRRGVSADGPPGNHVPNYHKGQQLRQLLELAFEIHKVADFVFDTKIALVEALIDEMFQEAMAPLSQVPDVGKGRVSQEIADRAREWIAEFFAEPITVQDVATAAGVDVRALQRAFSDWLGLSPRQYIAELRLDAMRAILVAGKDGTTVTSAASACGLFHFGRVGQAYKLRFGELPSQTLRQSRV